MVWGTGFELVLKMIRAIRKHPLFKNIEFKFNHRVVSFIGNSERVTGFTGLDEKNNEKFSCEASQVIIASGGVAGNIPWMMENWYKPWGSPPEFLLNGSHQFSIDSTVF